MLTRKQHLNLINQELPYTKEEKEKIIEFEDYMKTSKEYSPFTSPLNQEYVRSYENEITYLESLPNLNQNQQDAVTRGEKIKNTISITEIREAKKAKEEEQALKLTLKQEKQAGYMEASTLLFIVFNIGIFIASLLLIVK